MTSHSVGAFQKRRDQVLKPLRTWGRVLAKHIPKLILVIGAWTARDIYKWLVDESFSTPHIAYSSRRTLTPVSSSTATYVYEESATLSNDGFRDGKDIEFTVSAPDGCSLATPTVSTNPAGALPLMHLSRQLFSPDFNVDFKRDVQIWTVGMIAKKQSITLTYTIFCVAKSSDQRLLIYVSPKNCLPTGRNISRLNVDYIYTVDASRSLRSRNYPYLISMMQENLSYDHYFGSLPLFPIYEEHFGLVPLLRDAQLSALAWSIGSPAHSGWNSANVTTSGTIYDAAHGLVWESDPSGEPHVPTRFIYSPGTSDPCYLDFTQDIVPSERHLHVTVLKSGGAHLTVSTSPAYKSLTGGRPLNFRMRPVARSGPSFQ